MLRQLSAIAHRAAGLDYVGLAARPAHGEHRLAGLGMRSTGAALGLVPDWSEDRAIAISKYVAALRGDLKNTDVEAIERGAVLRPAAAMATAPLLRWRAAVARGPPHPNEGNSGPSARRWPAPLAVPQPM